ncbi:hypothetical protein EVAR_62484_1 [Eumeta japonica]|uniref:Uncharacterized protein n=1 Tax=Eumeta variegata TaxID=151549 RepID=A0A4C1ZMZ2_EUMVA|nr:hypothetical protein EVAR_62484_1 [Eumeta japonica]
MGFIISSKCDYCIGGGHATSHRAGHSFGVRGPYTGPRRPGGAARPAAGGPSRCGLTSAGPRPSSRRDSPAVFCRFEFGPSTSVAEAVVTAAALWSLV